MRIAIAGLGTVGCGFINMIHAKMPANVEIVGVSARRKDVARVADISAYEWVDDPLEFVTQDDIDCIVELIGGSEGLAKELVFKALKNGKSVITANKALIADHGKELGKVVDAQDVFFGFEAAVAGGIPIIKSLRESFTGNDIQSLQGILNGTGNYILSAMAETGRDFADILKEAQELGYAEADPSFDVGGIDAAHKLAIMAGIAFQQEVSFNDLYVQGIERIKAQDINYAKQAGYRLKTLGIATISNMDNSLNLSVEPCFVHKSHPIAHVDGVLNAVTVKSVPLGMSMLVGNGAGAGPTASSVYADLLDFVSGVKKPLYGVAQADMSRAVVNNDKAISKYYIRVHVKDEVGVVAEIASCLAKWNISISDLVQNASDGLQEAEGVDVFIMLHDIDRHSLISAVQELEKSDKVLAEPLALKVL